MSSILCVREINKSTLWKQIDMFVFQPFIKLWAQMQSYIFMKPWTYPLNDAMLIPTCRQYCFISRVWSKGVSLRWHHAGWTLLSMNTELWTAMFTCICAATDRENRSNCVCPHTTLPHQYCFHCHALTLTVPIQRRQVFTTAAENTLKTRYTLWVS